MRYGMFSSKTVLLSCAAMACAALAPVAVASASTTYTTVTANLTGGGNWTNPAIWSTNPNDPNNNTPASTVYDVNINSLGVGVATDVNVDAVTLGPGLSFALIIGFGGTLNLAQPDHSQAPGDFTAGINGVQLAGGTLANATLESPGGGNNVGDIYIPPASGNGTIQNVVLGSTFSIGGDSTVLDIVNSATLPDGINLNGYTLQLSALTANFKDATGANGADIGEVIDNGTISTNGLINAAGSLTVGSHGIVELTNGPGVDMTGNTLLNNGSVIVKNANSYIDTSYFTNSSTGTVTVYSGSSLNIESVHWVNNGLIQTSNAAGLTHAGGATLEFNGAWTNNGSIDLSTNDFIFFGSQPATGGSGSINNNGNQSVGSSNTGSINVGSATVTGVNASFVGPDFANSGTMIVYGGSVLSLGQNPTIANPLVTNWSNSGTIATANAISGGSATGATINLAGNWSNSNLIEVGPKDYLEINGNWSNAGTIQAAAGATIDLSGTFHPADVSLASSGSNGAFNPNGATVNFEGTLVNTGNNLVFGPASGGWHNNGGTIEGGTLAIDTQANGSPYFNFSGLSLIGVTQGSDLNIPAAGGLIVESGPDIQPSLISNGYAVNAAAGAYVVFLGLRISGVSYLSASYDGTINVNGPGAGILTEGGAVLTLTSTAIVNALGGAGSADDLQGQFVNDGVINVGSNAVTGTTATLTDVTNNGTISVYSGNTAELFGFANLGGKATNNGIIRILSGGTVSLGNNGLSPSLELASDSTLEIQLGSNGAGGLLTANGNLLLDSGTTLSLFQLAGSTITTPYDIINYTGTLTGTFTNVTPGYVLDYSHNGEILVTAVPEPATLALFALGFAGLMLKRRASVKRTSAA